MIHLDYLKKNITVSNSESFILMKALLTGPELNHLSANCFLWSEVLILQNASIIAVWKS